MSDSKSNNRKWTVVPNKAGYQPSRHVLRRLEMKAKTKGLVSNWDYIQVLDSGALMLSTFPLLKSEAELVAVPDGKAGKQARWKFMTEREYLDQATGPVLEEVEARYEEARVTLLDAGVSEVEEVPIADVLDVPDGVFHDRACDCLDRACSPDPEDYDHDREEEFREPVQEPVAVKDQDQ